MYEHYKDIPEMVDERLWLPADRGDKRVTQEEKHTETTMTPVEVGNILYTEPGWLYMFRGILEGELSRENGSEKFLTDYWANHNGRIVVRVALDPDRYAPIDMVSAFDQENARGGARFASSDDRRFFGAFHEEFGLLEDRASSIDS